MAKRYLIFVGMFVLLGGLVGTEWNVIIGIVLGFAGFITIIGALGAILLDPPERVDLDTQEEGARREATINHSAFQWRQ